VRNPKLLIAGVIGLAAAGGGIAAASSGSASPTRTSPAAQAAPPQATPAPGSSTINVATESVNGRTERILVNAQGLPLYTYAADTSTRSAVTGGLAALWPPLTSAAPTESGATGQVKAVLTSNGSQVQYNGHFLYTFVSDSPGRVTGQGFQSFFVATPSGTSTPAPSQPKPAPSYSYGY
jgi:predicted lipoprotein with Yx(FWY)xxD motif